MTSEQKIRETMIWLAGLLSTDGTIHIYRERTRGYKIYSAEREWLDQIADKLLEVGIKTSVHRSGERGLGLSIHMPYRITQLLKKYAEGFMIERKWKKVISGYRGESRNLWAVNCEKKHFPWMPEEDQFLIENYSKMTYDEIAKHLARETRYAVGHRVQRLKKIGAIPLVRKRRRLVH